MSIFPQAWIQDPGPRPKVWHPVSGRCFPARTGDPEIAGRNARAKSIAGLTFCGAQGRCCTALAESEIRLWWWPRYVSSMKYPKRCQYKHAKQKKYHVRNWAEYNEGAAPPGRFDSLV